MVWASDLECNVLHGETDSGKGIVGNLLAGAAIIAAGYNSYRAVEIATKEWEMAKKYWQIAQNWLDYYRDYFAPVEDQELNEAMNLPITTPEYDVARGRARAVAWIQFKNVLNTAMRCTSRYCTGLRQDMLADMSAAQADAIAMADALGYRNERAYTESRNDVRFDKMLNTAKRGRDLVADNVSHAKATAGIYGDLFEQAWSGLSGAGQYLGYWGSRNDTRYPTTFLASRQAFQRQGSGGPVLYGPPDPREGRDGFMGPPRPNGE